MDEIDENQALINDADNIVQNDTWSRIQRDRNIQIYLCIFITSIVLFVVLLLVPYLIEPFIDHQVYVLYKSKVPIITYNLGSSNFRQVYEPSFINSNTVDTTGIIVTVQNCSTNNECVYCDDKSKMVFTECDIITGNCNSVKSDIVFETNYSIDGSHIVYNSLDKYYYMVYNGNNNKLSLAKSQTPNKEWINIGNIKDGKFGIMMLNGTKNYLFWNDDTSIHLSESNNMYDWNNSKILLEPRLWSWDSQLLESGSSPILLSNGNYLFFYNAQELGYPKNPFAKTNIGYVILNKDLSIKKRSEIPLISPTELWEIGSEPFSCNYPSNVYVESAIKLNNDQKTLFAKIYKIDLKSLNNLDIIRIYYSGSKSHIGTAIIAVKM